MKKEVIWGLLFGTIAAGGFSSESDGIYVFKIGQMEICVMIEGERDGNVSIVPGADEALLRRYISAAGFKHSTNAFLIKAPGQNILVDSGMGTNNIILEKIKKLGVTPEQLNAVLITHLHGDHIGTLQRNGKALFPNAKIYIDAKEHEYFTRIQPNQGAVAALNSYGSNVITFDAATPGSAPKEILPGIGAIAAYGHTPGHTAFLVESGAEKLLIAGDFLHVGLVQFPCPDISATYDMNQNNAAASRRQLLDYAAKNKIILGGMHIVFPGVGKVETDGSGYKFFPSN